MRRILVGLLVLVLVVGLVSPALAAKGGIKGKPEVLPARPRGTQTETRPLGKALGQLKFELEGVVTKALDGPTGAFEVKVKRASRSIRKVLGLKSWGKKSFEEKTLTVHVDGNTRYFEKGARSGSDAYKIVALGKRIHVSGRINKETGELVARKVVVRPVRKP